MIQKQAEMEQMEQAEIFICSITATDTNRPGCGAAATGQPLQLTGRIPFPFTHFPLTIPLIHSIPFPLECEDVEQI